MFNNKIFIFSYSSFSFFHLLTHAMSLLFLCSGIFIFYMNDNQDIRMMGSISVFMTITCSCFISSLTLCGIPFLSGLYSKDFIIVNLSFNGMNLFIFFIFYISLGLTAFYSSRLFFYSMIMNYKFLNLNFIKDDFIFMKLSIFILNFFLFLLGVY